MVVAAAVVAAVMFVPKPPPARTTSGPEIDAALVQAVRFFLDDRLDQALRVLGDDALLDSAKAAYLTGVVLLYQNSGSPEAARRAFRRASAFGFPAADVRLGMIAYGEACEACLEEADSRFSKAFDGFAATGSANPEAELWMALSWIERGYWPAAFAPHLRAVAERAEDDELKIVASLYRAWTIRPGAPAAAETLLEYAAGQGWPQAEFDLGQIYLRRGYEFRGEELTTMAALQGVGEATDWLRGQDAKTADALRRKAEASLDALPADPSTYLGQAARWCARQNPADRRCLWSAVDDHFLCALSFTTKAVLGIADFESSRAYSACRVRELTQHRLNAR